jgi:hypothetical protein
VRSHDEEGGEVAVARVVSFEGVSAERITQLEREIRDGGRPEGLDPTQMLLLHDPEQERSLVILIFADDEAYRRGDAILDAMPSGDTPGRRTAVTRYEVAIDMDG